MPESTADLKQRARKIWNQTAEYVSGTVNVLSLTRALETALPLTIDDGQFIVGYQPEDFARRSFLQDARYLKLIEQTLASAAGEALRLRVIEGTELPDWEAIKKMEAANAAFVSKPSAPKAQPAVAPQGDEEKSLGDDWDHVGEVLARRYASLPHRSLSCVQGEFLEQCVRELARAYRRLMPAEGEPSEMLLRAYARVLERIAERAEVSAPFIHYEVRRQLRMG